MKNKHSYKIAIIGLGKVGTAIGHLLKKSGHEIIAISDKSAAAREKAMPYTGGENFRDPKKAVMKADVILITTPDDAILATCNGISDSLLVKEKFVFHMSGAGSLELLDAAKRAGAVIASIHPVQSFSSVDNAIQNIPGSVFGITADKKAARQAKIIVRDLGGIPVTVSLDQKPLYHAAACFASNYLVSLLSVVESIYRSVGINETNARRAYLHLIYGTLKNIEASGPVGALTGPIARGDINTVRKHIAAIDEQIPKYSSLYSALGLIATDIAQKKGTLSSRKAKIITDLLKGAINHEHPK